MRSAGNVEILVSSTTHVGNLVSLKTVGFLKATGLSDYAGFDVDLSGLAASALNDVRLVRFNIISNYGDTNGYVGLSEVQFMAVPECSLIVALPLSGMACAAAGRRRRRLR